MFHSCSIQRLLVPIRLLVAVIFALAIPLVANAQVLYGSVTGNVTDQKGAGLPGVKVTVTNVGTSSTRDITTDERGGYLVSNLLPGSYTVTFEANSFKKHIAE